MHKLLFILPILALLAAGCPQGRQQRRTARPGTFPPQTSSPAPAPDQSTQLFCPAPTPPSEAPLPVWRPVAGRVVILDAGHGGRDEGAAYFGLREKEVNLDVARRTAAWLRARGVVVHLTRDADVFVGLPERSAFANRHPNAVFVSIHSNAAAGGPAASGIETFALSDKISDEERALSLLRYNVPGNSREEGKKTLRELAERSRKQGPELASSIQRSLARRLADPDRGVKRADFAVLRDTYFCPAALVEIGFMSHPATAGKMATPAWRDRTATAIGEGVVDFMRRIE